LTQEALAERAGVSVSLVQKLEQGRRTTARSASLSALARAVGTDMSVLLDGRAGRRFQSSSVQPFGPAAPVRAALLGHGTSDDLPPAGALQRAVVDLQTRYQAARYDDAGALAPRVIGGATALVSLGTAEALRAAAIGLHAITALLSRVGHTELAWLCADRALAAARTAGDDELLAVGLLRLANVLVRAGHLEDAWETARLGTVAAGATGDVAGRISVLGSLHLVAAVAAGHAGERRDAEGQLERAHSAARRLGSDRNDHWTAFGPTNVRIHAASVAVALGDHAGAIRRVADVDLHRLPAGLRGRRSQVHRELAVAYAGVGNDHAAVQSLGEATRLAPERLRFDPVVRDLVGRLRSGRRRLDLPGLRELALRAGFDG
jgi:transcriptional regulator with XRE-family HTH domain